MTDLLTRLEAASEGSRGLDYEIHEHLGWRDDDECGWFHEATEVRTESTDWPHYTTSLDAALTLVPEGYGWTIYSGHGGFLPRAVVSNGGNKQFGETAATPALALCIAALRARG